MPIKKAINAKRDLTRSRPLTMGGLLDSHLAAYGAARRVARRAGISEPYLSRMRNDQIFHVSKPIKRTLSDALGISVQTLSDALAATERHLTATASKQGRNK